MKCGSCQKWMSIVVACISVGTASFASYWNNLSTYTTSYLQRRSHSASGEMIPWVLPLWVFGSGGGYILSSILSQKMGGRMTFACGILLQSVGISAVYFCINISAVAISFCLGLVNGIGSGIIQSANLQILVEWAGKQHGFFIGIHRSSMVIGGAITNQLLTVFLNPGNKTPNQTVKSLVYFTQSEIIESVPSAYLVLGVLYFGIQIACLLIVTEKPSTDMHDGDNVSDIPGDGSDEEAGRGECKQQKEGQCMSGTLKDKPQYGTLTITPTLNTPAIWTQLRQLCCQSRESDSTKHDGYDTNNIFRTVEFFVFFFTMALATVPYIVINNFFKSFGQLWFHDDYFLVIVWDMYLLAMILAVPAWGIFLDNYSVKIALMVYFTVLPLIYTVIYFFPMIYGGSWLFSVTMIVYGMFGSPLLPLYAACISTTFGKRDLARNFGLVSMSWGVTSLVLPVFIGCVLDRLGWFYVFGLAALSCIVALFTVVTALGNSVHNDTRSSG